MGRDTALGYAMGARLEYIMQPIAFGFGTGIVAMVGTNWGAQQYRRAREIAWTGASIVALLCGIIGLIVAFEPILWIGLFSDDADVRSWYAEASYRFLRRWQAAVQYERSRIVLAPGDESIPDTLLNHSSFGLGIDCWVSPEFVLKLSGYTVSRNLIARPADAGLHAALGTIDKSTGVVVLGAQFSF